MTRRKRQWQRKCLWIAGLLLLLVVPVAQAALAVQSGVMRVGINNYGLPGFQEDPIRQSTAGYPNTGVRYVELTPAGSSIYEDEIVGTTTLSFGWTYRDPSGVSRATCNVSVFGAGCGASAPGFANVAGTITPLCCGGPEPEAAFVTPRSVDAIQAAQVGTRLEYRPAVDGVYEVKVEITNLLTGPTDVLQDFHLRQSLRFAKAVPPGYTANPGVATAARVSIDGTLDPLNPPPTLLYSNSNGGVPAAPAYPYDGVYNGAMCNPMAKGPGVLSTPLGGNYFDNFGGVSGSACWTGAQFVLDLDDILPGETKRFWMYYAAGKRDVLVAMGPAPAGVGAEIWAYGWSDSKPPAGVDPDFVYHVWGFRGLFPPAANFVWSSMIPTWTIPGQVPWNPLNVCAGSLVTFADASSQVAPGVVDLAHSLWDFDGPGSDLGYQAGNSYTWDTPGTYQVGHRIRNDNGFWSSVIKDIVVVDCKVVPIGSIVVDHSRRDCVDSRTRFSAVASDPDGGTVSISWDFGDGATATGPDVFHLYATNASVLVRMTIVDDEGQTTVVSQTVTPVGDLFCPPVVERFAKFTVYPGSTFEVTVHAMDIDGIPVLTLYAADLPLGATWSPTPGTSTAQATLTYTVPSGATGTFLIPVTALDGDGLTDAMVLVLQVAAFSTDSDQDGIAEEADNCPTVANPSQADWNGNGLGDACDDERAPVPATSVGAPAKPSPDQDRDGIEDVADNCPEVPNLSQSDWDNNGIGDACDVAPSTPVTKCPPWQDHILGATDADNCPSVTPLSLEGGCPTCGQGTPMSSPATPPPVVGILLGFFVAGFAILLFALGARRRREPRRRGLTGAGR